MDDTEAVPWEFLKTSAKKRKGIQCAPKSHGSRRSKRAGNDDSGILRDHLRWNRSLLPSFAVPDIQRTDEELRGEATATVARSLTDCTP
jgi:hypothetical protein